MTLEQLRIFVAVAERLNMTAAARALNLTQSAASGAVAALEARHGVKLFDRVGRGLQLSAAGRAFLPEAQGVLARADGAQRALDDLAGLKRGEVRLAASQTVASYWVPGRAAAFARVHPTIALTLRVGNSQQVADQVLSGAVDLGLVEGEVAHDDLVRKVVGEDRISLYVAPGHPLARGGEVTLADLDRAQWVLREKGSGTRAAFEAAYRARGGDPERLKVLLEFPSNESALAAAAGGGLVTPVSDLAAAPRLASGSVARAPFDLGKRRFTAIRHRDRPPSRALAAFLEMV
jgi:DNA-binding transcriptional LysR family regulator